MPVITAGFDINIRPPLFQDESAECVHKKCCLFSCSTREDIALQHCFLWSYNVDLRTYQLALDDDGASFVN